MKVTICFNGNLENLLSARQREKTHQVAYVGKRSLKDLIESFSIPHTEVGKLLVNGNTAGFFYILQDGDKIDVYPVSSAGDAAAQNSLSGEATFLCDVHLWKLARRLRLLGFDVAFDNEWDDAQLADIAQGDGRILLSRDRGLLIRKKVTRAILIRSTDTEEQVKEVLNRLSLCTRCKPFSRCLLCGGLLKQVEAGEADFEKIEKKIPAKVLVWCREYNICSSCGHVYWKGSHYKKLLVKVNDYLGT
ncbi:MAG: twitching motility protein PilT [Candidatus Aminicenantes bacterium]|nr:twitching motility protein PilT [Candidatus Aminicenantes bacterium]